MFGLRLGNPRKKLVSITNLNDLYISTLEDVRRVLGSNNRLVRKRNNKKIFVIDFDGDVTASQSTGLTYEVTTILCSANKGDEVLVRLSSPGGAAHAYGYAATQLSRFKKAGIPLTIAVDRVAASGGYLMACVADKIIASPWAIIGSIGVVAEFPNFFNFLQSLGIEYKQYTAGEFKRTVSSMGPVTQEGEQKFKENLFDVYKFFRQHVIQNRPILGDNLDKISTGEHWHGIEALDLKLIDEVKTSEEFILDGIKDFEFIKISYVGNRKGFMEKLGSGLAQSFAEGLVKSFYNNFLTLFYTKDRL